MADIFRILSKTDNKGKLLEEVIEDVFLDMNFQNVKRQRSGSQYGFDVIAYKDNECWKAECKNLSTEATVNDIAPKIIWHIDSLSVDRFVIVSLNGISNDLQHLLEMRLFSFPIEVWYGKYLEKVITESPRALRRLDISPTDGGDQTNVAKPLVFLPNELKFDVFYSRGLPYSYDYFELNDEQIKAYSDDKFRLYAVLYNNSAKSFVVKEIIVRTTRFESLSGKRILRQRKMKGVVTPMKMTFIPKNYTGGETEINQENIVEINPFTKEYVEFQLSRKGEPGYYELVFEIHCRESGRDFSLLSTKFSLNIRDAKSDLATLNVVGKYYDTPVKDILNLESNSWNTIKQEYRNGIKFLGPSINDISLSKDMGSTWTINLLKGKLEKTGHSRVLTFNPRTKSKVLIDLKTPIEERIFSVADAINHIAQHRTK